MNERINFNEARDYMGEIAEISKQLSDWASKHEDRAVILITRDENKIGGAVVRGKDSNVMLVAALATDPHLAGDFIMASQAVMLAGAKALNKECGTLTFDVPVPDPENPA